MENRVYLYGITGKARSGKDTCAREITTWISRLGRPVTIISLASPMKYMMEGLLDCLPLTEDSEAYLHGELKEKVIPQIGFSPRHLMQTLGTEWGRNTLDKDMWVRILLGQADWFARSFSKLTPIVIVPDVRFNNEAAYMHELMYVSRPNTHEVREHSSEAGVADDFVTHYFDNDGTLDDIRGMAMKEAHRLDVFLKEWDNERAGT